MAMVGHRRSPKAGSELTDPVQINAPPLAPRRIALLQGPPGRFWSELGDAFAAAGHETHHIRLSSADALFWRGGPGVARHSWRGPLKGWRAWMEAFVARHAITDVLYYSDRLPYHVAAGEVIEAAGGRAWAVEFGYLRPDWITLERQGMGAYSRFPDDPETVADLAARFHPQPLDMTPRHHHPFAQEALNEVLFNLAGALFFWPYPRFNGQGHYHPLSEYLSWARRLPGGLGRVRRGDAAIARLAGTQGPIFAVALQLESDRQIRDNAPFSGQRDMITEVLGSFKAHAPGDARIVFKTHPLDNGLERWPREVMRIAHDLGLEARTEVIEGGSLDDLLALSRGVVATNSTVGLHAIRAGRPVVALGCAIYDMKGLTHQGPLAQFWTAPEAPDPDFADAFMRALAGTIQIRGSFYAPEGRREAAAEIVARIGLPAGTNALDAACRPAPPRLPVRRRAADM
ncbi:MAG: capsular polysaccharide export protein [Paracoccaceae bacterium]|jgi:capsular polysaccharide export protein